MAIQQRSKIKALLTVGLLLSLPVIGVYIEIIQWGVGDT